MILEREIMDDKNRFGVENVFKSMNDISNRSFNQFKEMLEQQTKGYQDTMESWMKITNNFGKNIMDVMEEENKGYEDMREIWKNVSSIPEEITKDIEEQIDTDLYNEMFEYNDKIREKISKMTESSYGDARELYHSWVKLNENLLSGLKAGIGMDLNDMMKSWADFQQTSVHVALEGIDRDMEELRELRDMLQDFSNKIGQSVNELSESENKRYQEQMKKWMENVNDMQEKVNIYLNELQKNYLRNLEPYFGQRAVVPFFPWLSRNRMKEYEQDIEELKDRLSELEERQSGD